MALPQDPEREPHEPEPERLPPRRQRDPANDDEIPMRRAPKNDKQRDDRGGDKRHRHGR